MKKIEAFQDSTKSMAKVEVDCKDQEREEEQDQNQCQTRKTHKETNSKKTVVQ
jgi:hypothetical protein